LCRKHYLQSPNKDGFDTIVGLYELLREFADSSMDYPSRSSTMVEGDCDDKILWYPDSRVEIPVKKNLQMLFSIQEGASSHLSTMY